MNKLEKKRIQDLYRVTECLERLKIHHVIFDGALLGFIREKNLIKWDPDVEIAIRYFDYQRNLIKIIESLEKLKIGRIKINNSYENPKLTINQNNFKYTLQVFHYSKDNKTIYRKMYKYPSKYIDEISMIKIMGFNFFIPKNAKELLELQYGKNWRIPLITKDKSEYLSPKIYTKINNKIFKVFFKFLDIGKNLLNKFIRYPRKILSKYPIIEYYLSLNREQIFIDQLNLVCRNKSKVIFIEIGSSDLKEAIILSGTNKNKKIICKIYEASLLTYQNLLRIRDSLSAKNIEIFNKAIVPKKSNYYLEINKYPNLNKMLYSKKSLNNKSTNILLSNIEDLNIDGIHKLVKMDIEGLEEKLLIENIEFLKNLSDISFTMELHQSQYNNKSKLEKVFYELLENRYEILFIELSRDCNEHFLNKMKKNRKILKKANGRFLIKYPPIDCIKYIVNTEYRIIKNSPYFSKRNIRSITLTKLK